MDFDEPNLSFFYFILVGISENCFVLEDDSKLNFMDLRVL